MAIPYATHAVGNLESGNLVNAQQPRSLRRNSEQEVPGNSFIYLHTVAYSRHHRRTPQVSHLIGRATASYPKSQRVLSFMRASKASERRARDQEWGAPER